MINAIKGFVADIARPYAIISLATATAAAEIIIATKVDGFDSAALFLGAAMTGVAGLYGAKSWENAASGKHAANVEIAKAAGPVPVVDMASVTVTTTQTAETPPAEPKP